MTRKIQKELDIFEPVPTKQCLEDMVRCMLLESELHPVVAQAYKENRAIGIKLDNHWDSLRVWMACVLKASSHKIQFRGDAKSTLDTLLVEAEKGWPFKRFIVDEMAITLLIFMDYFKESFPESAYEIVAIMGKMIEIVEKHTKA